MTTRSGWTFNDHHYTECISQRMGAPHITYHRDGVPMKYSGWRRAMTRDQKADMAKERASPSASEPDKAG